MEQVLVAGVWGRVGEGEWGSLETVLCSEFPPQELELINQPATYAQKRGSSTR